MRYVLTSVLLALSLTVLSQSAKLISGPMLGYTAHHEQLIWIEVAEDVEQVAINYWTAENEAEKFTKTYEGTLGRPFNPLRIVLTGLEMSTKYIYEIVLDEAIAESGQPQSFTTTHLWEWREPAPNFSFLFGSCMYVNDSIYDRPGEPYGQGLKLVKEMGNTESDFMLWGGDNTYLREADWSSENGVYYRFSHDRSQPEIAKLLATRPNYAILDDHDFGPNNSNRAWLLKDETLKVFTEYWGNQTAGERDNPGAYTMFEWSDCDFFLLDNRYHRSPRYYRDSLNGDWNKDKSYLGEEQLQWLKDNLVNSRATFKFIVTGSQAINFEGRGECYCEYQKELNELLSFIKEYHVEGVIFLSGDRHYSEILKFEQNNSYPIYEITSSPMSSRAYADIAKNEGDNSLRLEGTLTNELNFMRLNVNGERSNRILTIETFDKNGKILWEKEISEEALEFDR